MTPLPDSALTAPPAPTSAEIRRWRRYLANERAEAAVYRDLVARRTGEEREILLGLAAAGLGWRTGKLVGRRSGSGQ